jgi:hypothetical protein
MLRRKRVPRNQAAFDPRDVESEPASRVSDQEREDQRYADEHVLESDAISKLHDPLVDKDSILQVERIALATKSQRKESESAISLVDPYPLPEIQVNFSGLLMPAPFCAGSFGAWLISEHFRFQN